MALSPWHPQGVPITVTNPVPPVIGPGLVVGVQSDLVGPIPVDWRWIIHIVRRGEEGGGVTIGAPIRPGLDHQQFAVIGDRAAEGFTFTVDTTNGLASTEPASVLVELRNALGVVQDSGSSDAYTWDSTTTLWNLTTGAAASFSASDRAQLDLVVANTSVPVPAAGVLGGVAVFALTQLLTSGFERFASRHGSILVSGQGSLARLSEPFRFDALGMEWHWNTIPAGFGRTLGSVDELGRRIVQWRMIRRDASGQLFQDEVIDSSTEGVRFMWGLKQPETIEWYVAPGCVVELAILVTALG